MAPDGWIRLYRQILEHDLWLEEAFTAGQAWVDLLLLAGWKGGSFRVRGIRVEHERGQLAVSIKNLAARWRWSRGKVKRFLKHLENEHQIEFKTGNVTTVITITNYDLYQPLKSTTDDGRTPSDTPSDTPNGTPNGSANGHNKEKTRKERTTRTQEEESPTIPETLQCEQFIAKWDEWISWRRSCRYSTKVQYQNRSLKNLAKHGLEAAIWAVDHSLTQSYQGLFPDKAPQSAKGDTNGEIREGLRFTG
jgi:hypothetical protein